MRGLLVCIINFEKMLQPDSLLGLCGGIPGFRLEHQGLQAVKTNRRSPFMPEYISPQSGCVHLF
jgi:hypothetical protein